jgi:energy-coupling factor transporter ATP-binding protein EcfA2
MLHHYTFSNFYSFQGSTTVDFRMPKTLRGPSVSGDRLLSKVIAVVGANGSGKTNLIKALAFVHWFISYSFRESPEESIPVETHFFSEGASTSFEVEFFAGKELWRYVVELTEKRVLHEALYRKTSRYFSYVFKRDWKRDAYAIEQQGFGMAPSQAKKVRENASLISTAAQYDVPIATMMARLPLFSNVAQIGRVHLNFLRIVEATDIFRKNESLRKQMVSLLQDWDFGLSDIVLKETEFREMDSTEVAKHYTPFGVHTDGEREAERMFVAESSGTQGAYVLLSHILPALAKGGVAVIDELEADLHPRMLAPIMDLFLSQQTNPKDAQIIFTCHAAEILNLLQKPQIMLVEKDEHSYSEAWRLDSVKGVRKDDNLYAKYMAGAYGAVPQV